jgi:hypothetical protein
MPESDFMFAKELSQKSGLAISTLRNSYQRGDGPLSKILCKLGSRRLGCWRRDWELFVASQRRLRDPSEEPRVAA